MDHRLSALSSWTRLQLKLDHARFKALSGDASFRRYFRVTDPQDNTYIAVDAPPPQENVQSFVTIAKTYLSSGLIVPEVLAFDIANGFMLLSDLGDTLFLEHIKRHTDQAPTLYQAALSTLHTIQGITHTDDGKRLPEYNQQQLLAEIRLFDQWLLDQWLAIDISDQQKALLFSTYQTLIDSALCQPSVGVHLDYHSRNLMVITGQHQPGIIDFQDARVGPISYDLVSLVKDCYIAWPDQDIQRWREQFVLELMDLNRLTRAHSQQFETWFDLMGMQRHLKAMGIFARLYCRDQKPGYLNDIPRTLNYVIDVALRHSHLTTWGKWLESTVKPVIIEKINT